MAAYYDYIPGAVQFRTPALDPSNEAGTFLSYKLTDWCNKIGPNYAQIWTNHEDWEASDRYVDGDMTSTDNAYLSIRLLGADHRAGTLAGTGINAWRGFGWWRRTSNRMIQMTSMMNPRRLDPTGSYERSNLERDSYGHIRYWDGGTFTASNNYYIMDNADFIPPRITRVLYSDTPGLRYFAWQINGENADYATGVIYEMQPRDGYPPGSDPGWALASSSGYYWRNLPTYNGSNLGNYRNYWPSNSIKIADTYTPGNASGSTYARPMISSVPLNDYHGDVVGYADGFHYGSSLFEENFSYRVGGKKYFAWTNSLLLPID